MQGLTDEFVDEPINVDALPADPMTLFRDWHGKAAAHEPWLGNAMTLATTDAAGLPSARIVLLRGVDSSGFHLYTNYT
ncbi:MAG TPA: pyridoxamine 5'-phosphate oxidase, partial [Verrucomicrobia bacterium]|nr:pyridoxamine 5'-phosphate oxidase [Verrucomicrobiota bacterium]